MDSEIQKLTVKELLRDSEYRIPIYQRNYAWGIVETTQLIQDIADYAQDNPQSHYYIGNLIVFPRWEGNRTYYETIDGQQRTTTLTILLCAIKNNISQEDILSWYQHINISFDHREKSNDTLNAIYNNTSLYNDADRINNDIMYVYSNAWMIIKKICLDKQLSIIDFIDYLLDQVHILRVSVPKETNLNHYFEIMNSRGEQLEKHEVVKATLMSYLKEDENAMSVFNLIWEACANMDRYVQTNFTKSVRIKLFKDKGTGELVNKDFEQLVDTFITSDLVAKEKEEYKSIATLFEDDLHNIRYDKPWLDNKEEDYPESYYSVLTFSNFLLHVLKIMRPNDENVILDDKKIILVFKKVLEQTNDKVDFVKQYIYMLLNVRYLFDKYIIKRKQEKWSLKQLSLSQSESETYYYKDTFSEKTEDENSLENIEIVMLLSMFHVSAPAQIYKHWLSAALFYVCKNPQTSANDYASFLWNLAKSYMLDRYLVAKEERLPFETIIYKNNGNPSHRINQIDWGSINIDDCPQVGEHVENFVFNFYDFLLWKEHKNVNFEFGYRNSVEHYYPQHPLDKSYMEFQYLHSFGNLCLVSRGMNSKFSNLLPAAKYEHFSSDDEMKSYSLKLRDMMNTVKSGMRWDVELILEKTSEAKRKLEKALLS